MYHNPDFKVHQYIIYFGRVVLNPANSSDFYHRFLPMEDGDEMEWFFKARNSFIDTPHMGIGRELMPDTYQLKPRGILPDAFPVTQHKLQLPRLITYLQLTVTYLVIFKFSKPILFGTIYYYVTRRTNCGFFNK